MASLVFSFVCSRERDVCQWIRGTERPDWALHNLPRQEIEDTYDWRPDRFREPWQVGAHHIT